MHGDEAAAGGTQDAYPVTPRTLVRRRAQRGHYERTTVHAILDEALVCHVGFVADGEPIVIPTAYARIAETLYLHGSPANRMLRNLADGLPVCVTVTLLDGIVLARSAFHHSMNYRSVVVLGQAHAVLDPAEKLRAMHALVEHVSPGRWDDARSPSEQGLAQTLVLALPLERVSAKVRTGPPIDDEPDHALPCWAGVIPLHLAPGVPLPDPLLAADRATPAYALRYRRPLGP
ncbi:MAG: pyridoxamine 5'-phosphate oxidase family protein [Myxococcales bacterium]|nr:MAG: pyridoxamine 5'-phosphate oxidase family protein [Myxococcales bacterium]